MRIAITVIRESLRISPLFEAAALAVVVDCCGGVIQSEQEVALPAEPDEKLALLVSLGVQVLLCGAIANETAALVAGHGLMLHSFAAGEWRDVLTGWQSARHVKACHLMPGCRRQRQQRCRNGQSTMRRKK